jgi:predicted CoA-binding protein
MYFCSTKYFGKYKMQSVIIKSFLETKNIAVIGVSSKGKGFGAIAYKHLRQNGHNTFPVNINSGNFENMHLYKSIKDIQNSIDGIITVVPPKVTEMIVKEANQFGIKKTGCSKDQNHKLQLNIAMRMELMLFTVSV